MSKELELLSSITAIPKEELTEKLANEEGAKEIQSKIEGFKVFRSGEEYTSHMNNYKNSVKDILYKEHKGSIHESLENKLLSKHGVDLKRGEHFSTTDELIDKILDTKIEAIKASAKGGTNEEVKKAQETIEALKNQFAQEKDGLIKDFSTKIISKEVNSALSGVKSMLDIEAEKVDSALKFVKFEFDQEFSLREVDGEYKVFKGDTIYRDENYKEIALDVVLQEIASKSFKLKNSPAAGRGVDKKTGNNASSPENFDFSAYPTWDAFKDAHTELRKLTTGDPRLDKWYEAFKKSKSNG